MKNKIIFISLFAFLFLGTWAMAYTAQAKSICFEPSVHIPGMGAFFEACKDGAGYAISPSSIGSYVASLYRYAAGIAGIVAMFMIVFAAWQWIMASGNAGKIDMAKDTIRGALVGLTLIFAGYLLMNSISSKLVDFKPLDIREIGGKYLAGDLCRRANIDGIVTTRASGNSAAEMCGGTYPTSTPSGVAVQCIDIICPMNYHCVEYENGRSTSVECPQVIDKNESIQCRCILEIPCEDLDWVGCDIYDQRGDLSACDANKCYGETIKTGEVFSAFCGVEDGNCNELVHINCNSNAECEARNFDEHTFCCNTDWQDQCGLISEAGDECMDS
jgi:hypothetical protein